MIRYVELNPVRAGMVRAASEYRWSSARAHTRLGEPRILDMSGWTWTAAEWAALLAEASESDCETIRQATYSGRPWGSEEFIQQLEQELDRNLAARKGGRPKKADADCSGQGSLW